MTFRPILFSVSATAIGVAALGVTAVSASAAPASKPKVHKFTLPAVTGVKTWGSYYTASGKAHITLCLKETAGNVDFALAVATATNATASHHKDLSIQILGTGKQACRSLVTSYTAHLYATVSSGTTDGKAHIGKIVKIY